MIDLENNFEIEYDLKNSVYFFLIDGEVSIADEILNNRDAIGIEDVEKVSVKALKKSKLLVIDVPMN